MTLQQHHARRSVLRGAAVAGNVTLVLGVLFALAVAYAYALSLGDSVNPPDWARVVGLVWLPVGLAGVPVGYYWARGGPREPRAELGLVVALAAALAFVVLVVVLG
jgi:hypothetical protein